MISDTKTTKKFRPSGLAARAPYFHNGSAATLEEAIEFYETRFALGLTAQEKADLLAFLKAL